MIAGHSVEGNDIQRTNLFVLGKGNALSYAVQLER